MSAISELDAAHLKLFNQWEEKSITLLSELEKIDKKVIQSSGLSEEDKRNAQEREMVKLHLEDSFRPLLYLAIRRTYLPDTPEELLHGLLVKGTKHISEKDPTVFEGLYKLNDEVVLNKAFKASNTLSVIIKTLGEFKNKTLLDAHGCAFFEILALVYTNLLGKNTFDAAFSTIQLPDYKEKIKELTTQNKDFVIDKVNQLKQIVETEQFRQWNSEYTIISDMCQFDKKILYFSKNTDPKFIVKISGDDTTKTAVHHMNIWQNKDLQKYFPVFIGSMPLEASSTGLFGFIANVGGLIKKALGGGPSSIPREAANAAGVVSGVQASDLTAVECFEHFSGLTLEKLIFNGITTEEKNYLKGKLTEAVKTLHIGGFLHLDINPKNIFIRMDGTNIVGYEGAKPGNPILFLNVEQSMWRTGSLVKYTSFDQVTNLPADAQPTDEKTVSDKPIGKPRHFPRIQSPSFEKWFNSLPAGLGVDQQTTTKINAVNRVQKYKGNPYYFTEDDDLFALEQTINNRTYGFEIAIGLVQRPSIEYEDRLFIESKGEINAFDFYVFSEAMNSIRKSGQGAVAAASAAAVPGALPAASPAALPAASPAAAVPGALPAASPAAAVPGALPGSATAPSDSLKARAAAAAAAAPVADADENEPEEDFADALGNEEEPGGYSGNAPPFGKPPPENE